MHELASELFPLPRSLTGDGVRQTLNRISDFLPGLSIHRRIGPATIAIDHNNRPINDEHWKSIRSSENVEKLQARR